jgi:hypothetical protein
VEVLLHVERLHILDFLVNGAMGLLRFLVKLMRRHESGMPEILGDEWRHVFTEVPGKAEVEARVWYARNPRRCEDCSPRARGQGQEDVRTGILNENVFENVPLDV